jgi:HD-GYP domain-containing protein (c-di-GMP phosphodiesterase class II)
MRRITANYAQPGMKLGYPVYDNYGVKLLSVRTELDADSIKVLRNNGVSEIFIEDSRVTDVAAGPLISPDIEGRVAQALRKVNKESVGKINISDRDIWEITEGARSMAEEMSIKKMGEVSIAAITSTEDYQNVQPVKAALLSIVLGQALKYPIPILKSLVMATLLKDIGYILLSRDIVQKKDVLTKEEEVTMRQHARHGYNLLRQVNSCKGDIATAILQHHEMWNGKGYPQNLKGKSISRFAQIISVADQYSALLSKRPGHKRAYMPHEAIEYIMAYSGEYFNPEIVELFVRRVPCYSSGLGVKLNTGEIAIVSDPKLGFVGRPIVRICYDSAGKPVKNPHDIDLSKAEFQRMLITQILDYD